MCKAWRESAIDPGGLAEYVRVPGHNLSHDCFKIPDTMSMEDAALIEPVACAVQALRRKSPVRQGDHVLVIGAGMMGQILMLLSKHYGARTVIAADRVPYRLQKSLELGADVAIDVGNGDLRDTASYSCGPPDTRDAANLIGKDIVTADRIVTNRFSLEEASKGFATVSAAQESIKTLVIINEKEARS